MGNVTPCMIYLLLIVCALYLLHGEPSFLERIGLSENLLESLFSFLLALLPRPTEHVGEHFVVWSVNGESFSVYDMKECFNGEEVYEEMNIIVHPYRISTIM